MTYRLIDSGDYEKLEQFGDYTLIRPCMKATWPKKHPELWIASELPESWVTEIGGILFKLSLRPGGQIGVFPEHAAIWETLQGKESLNLFAYTGGATIALARHGSVCHVDASKAAVEWAKENAALNGVENIRWIVEDAMTFLRREVERGKRYDTIVLDPPSFGRGPKGEIFKLEKDLIPMLELCRALHPKIVVLSCHTTGITPSQLTKMAAKVFSGKIESGELDHSTIFVKIYVKN
jgi:23S rRNA (cytosine1962-C5)-methyltransferase